LIHFPKSRFHGVFRMSHLLESLMYQASQVFLFPTWWSCRAVRLCLLSAGHVCHAVVATPPGQGGQPTRGHHLLAWAKAQPGASADELDVRRISCWSCRASPRAWRPCWG
jgi:hypothetical protein